MALDPHLGRLAASLAALYDLEPPVEARELIAEAAARTTLGRLRLTVAPHARATVEVRTIDEDAVFPNWDRAVELRPVVVPGGVGAHKWADRRLLSSAEADLAPAVPLVVDSDGAVLEASRGSIFLVARGALITPPADGRLLPGITRSQVVNVAGAIGIELREEVVDADSLVSADEVFLTGAVRGVEPVRACRGLVRWQPGSVTGRIAAGLRRVWLN